VVVEEEEEEEDEDFRWWQQNLPILLHILQGSPREDSGGTNLPINLNFCVINILNCMILPAGDLLRRSEAHRVF